jgi:hypothetical protein
MGFIYINFEKSTIYLGMVVSWHDVTGEFSIPDIRYNKD